MKFHCSFAILFAALMLSGLASVHALPVRFLAWDDEIADRSLALVDAKSVTEIPGLHPAKRTPMMNVVTGENPLQIRALDRFDAEGRPLQMVLPISPGLRRPLVLLLPAEKSEIGVRVITMEDDPSGFRWGTMRVMNTTGQRVMFNWDQTIRPVAPGWRPVDMNPGGSARNMMVRIFLPETDRPIYSSIWRHDDRARQLVFLVPSEDRTRGPVAFKLVVERRSRSDIE